MKYSTRTYRRWLRRIALGLAVAAVAVPSAQAADPAQVTIPEGWENAQFGPANLPVVTKPTPVAPSDILNGQWGPANFVTAPAPVKVIGPSGFDFRDAAVGAAIAIAAMLLAAAALLITRGAD